MNEMTVFFWIAVALFHTVYTIENRIQCPPEISVAVGEEKTISCLHNVTNPDVYYWKHNAITIATIENGIRALPTKGYNISDDGSLVIMNASYPQQGRYSFVISTAKDERLSGDTNIVIYNKDPYVPTTQSNQSSESISKQSSTESVSNTTPLDDSPIILLAILVPIVVVCVICIGVLIVVCRLKKGKQQEPINRHPMDQVANVANAEEGEMNEYAPLMEQLTIEEKLQQLVDKLTEDKNSIQTCLDSLKQFLIDEKIFEEECQKFLLDNHIQTTNMELLQPWLQDVLESGLFSLNVCMEIFLHDQKENIDAADDWLTIVRNNNIISQEAFLIAYMELVKIDQQAYLLTYKEMLFNQWRARKIPNSVFIELAGQLLAQNMVCLEDWLDYMFEAEKVYQNDQIYAEDYLQYLLQLSLDNKSNSDKVIEVLLQYLKDKRITSTYYVDALLKFFEAGEKTIDYVADDFRYQVSRKEIEPRIFVKAMLDLIHIKEDAEDTILVLLQMVLNENYFPAVILQDIAEETYQENKISSDLYEKLLHIVSPTETENSQ